MNRPVLFPDPEPIVGKGVWYTFNEPFLGFADSIYQSESRHMILTCGILASTQVVQMWSMPIHCLVPRPTSPRRERVWHTSTRSLVLQGQLACQIVCMAAHGQCLVHVQ